MSDLIPYADLQKMAKDVVQSRLFPVKNESEAIALFMLCQAEGLHPMRALRMFDIIQGRPAIKPKALMASLTERGGRVEWIQNDAEACVGKFFGRACPDGVVVKFDVEDAKAAGLLNKPGPWQQYRADMLRHRCTGRGVDMVDPAAAFGLYSTPVTQDIVDDDKPVPTEAEVVGTERLQEMDAEGKTTDEHLAQAAQRRAEAVAKYLDQPDDPGPQEPPQGEPSIFEKLEKVKEDVAAKVEASVTECLKCGAIIETFDHDGKKYRECHTRHMERYEGKKRGDSEAKIKARSQGHYFKWIGAK